MDDYPVRFRTWLDNPSSRYGLQYKDPDLWAYAHPVLPHSGERLYRLVHNRRVPGTNIWDPVQDTRHRTLQEVTRAMRDLVPDLDLWKPVLRPSSCILHYGPWPEG